MTKNTIKNQKLDYTNFSKDFIDNLLSEKKLIPTSSQIVESEKIKIIDSFNFLINDENVKIFIYKQTLTFKNDNTKIKLYAEQIKTNDLISDFFKNNF